MNIYTNRHRFTDWLCPMPICTSRLVGVRAPKCPTHNQRMTQASFVADQTKAQSLIFWNLDILIPGRI